MTPKNAVDTVASMPPIVQDLSDCHCPQDRAERLAQAILETALREDASLRAYLARELSLKGLTSLGSVRPTDPITVKPEDPSEGWRADLLIKEWNCRIEVKIDANLTRGQAAAKDLDILVIPDARDPEFRDLRSQVLVVSWAKLASAAEPPYRYLLSTVDSSTYRVTELWPERLRQDMDAFLGGGDDRSWWSMYAFLSSVRAELKDRLSCGGVGLSNTTRGETPYYGMRVTGAGNVAWWVGFSREDATGSDLLGAQHWGRPDTYEPAPASSPWRAVDVATWIATTCG